MKLRKIIGWILAFCAITSCDCWRTLFSNRHKHYVDADIDGAWFIEHQRCGNVPYIK